MTAFWVVASRRVTVNCLAQLYPLSALKELADLGLAATPSRIWERQQDWTACTGWTGPAGDTMGDLRPLTGSPSLVWVHVGGSRIEDVVQLDGPDRLKVARRDDLERPSAGDGPPSGHATNAARRTGTPPATRIGSRAVVTTEAGAGQRGAPRRQLTD